MGDKTPGCRARQTRIETETGVDGVLHTVKPSHVRTETFGFDDVRTNDVLHEVNLVGCQVVEIAAASSNVWLQAPRQVLAVVVEFARRDAELNLHGEEFSQDAAFHNLLDTLEIRQVTAVISHKARYAGRLGNAVDAQAVFVVGSHRLFDIDRLARMHGHEGKRDV